MFQNKTGTYTGCQTPLLNKREFKINKNDLLKDTFYPVLQKYKWVQGNYE